MSYSAHFCSTLFILELIITHAIYRPPVIFYALKLGGKYIYIYWGDVMWDMKDGEDSLHVCIFYNKFYLFWEEDRVKRGGVGLLAWVGCAQSKNDIFTWAHCHPEACSQLIHKCNDFLSCYLIQPNIDFCLRKTVEGYNLTRWEWFSAQKEADVVSGMKN